MYQGFNHTKYLMRRKWFAIMGRWSIYDPNQNEVFYCQQKWSLKTDIHIYSDKTKQNEVLVAKTKQIIDFSAAYDISDPKVNEKIGAVKRKGLKSLLRDEWIIMDKYDKEIGLIKEDSLSLALLRRFFLNWLLPKRYSILIGNTLVGTLRKHFNPFVWKTTINFSQDQAGLLDQRIGIALALLVCAIGERQK
ncbi:MAG: hypothetical protein LRZ96_00255 [Candidatus Pacebacteria bacterium]|nr:hypothetical protein [Candidatus Paceibacterota bacterium]